MAGYAELHCSTHFSCAAPQIQSGWRSAPRPWVRGSGGDRRMLRSWSRAHAPGPPGRGPKAIVGSEFTLEEGPKIVLLAPDRTSYGALCSLITQARRRCEKGHYRLSLRDLTAQRTAQSLALWLPDPSHSIEAQQPWGEALKAAFPERLWLALGCFDEGDDAGVITRPTP